jgi:transcriptional regulator with XRE-family HTH domain
MQPDNLRDLKKKSGMSNKYLAEQMHMSERTIGRIFAGKTSLDIDQLRRLVLIMHGSADDILDLVELKVPVPEMEALQNENAALTAKIKELTDSLALLQAEIAIQKDKINALTAENDLVRLKLEHKEEIIALHNYYIKLKSGE